MRRRLSLGLCAYVDKGCPPSDPCHKCGISTLGSCPIIPFARGYGLFVLRGHASRKGAVYTSVSRTNDSAAILRFAAVAVLCLTVAVSMQIAANYFNDYADGVKGVDAGRSDEDAKRPESGAAG